MASVFTQRFLLVAGTNGQYVVPAGYRAIARTLLVYQGEGATGGAALFLSGVAVAQLLPGEYKSQSLETRLPAYAGEMLHVQTFSASSTAMVAGFIFEDPSGPIGRMFERQVADVLPVVAG